MQCTTHLDLRVNTLKRQHHSVIVNLVPINGEYQYHDAYFFPFLANLSLHKLGIRSYTKLLM